MISDRIDTEAASKKFCAPQFASIEDVSILVEPLRYNLSSKSIKINTSLELKVTTQWYGQMFKMYDVNNTSRGDGVS